MWFRVCGLGFRVYGSGFGVRGSGFRVSCAPPMVVFPKAGAASPLIDFRVRDLGFEVSDSVCRI